MTLGEHNYLYTTGPLSVFQVSWCVQIEHTSVVSEQYIDYSTYGSLD